MTDLPTLPTSEVILKVEDPPTIPRRELLTPLNEVEGDYLLVLDNSAMSGFTTCPRYAWHHEVLGREAHARNAALVFGGACHVGWEHIERDEGKTEIPTNAGPRLWNDIDTAQRVLQFFTENPAPPDEYRTPQTALELLAHYRVRRKLPDYQWTLLSDAVGPIIERPFEIPLGVFDVNAVLHLPSWEAPRRVARVHAAWSGRIDLAADISEEDYIVDHKTTSIGGDNYIQGFQLADQTIGYVWAAQQLWPEHDISSFCLNAAHLRRPTPGVGLMDKGPRGGQPALAFFRAYYHYTPERISQWEENATTLVENFLSALVRDRFPMHTPWCFSKFGKCQYNDVCTMDDPQVRMNMLMSDMFKDVTWNPTSAR